MKQTVIVVFNLNHKSSRGAKELMASSSSYHLCYLGPWAAERRVPW